MQQIHASSRPGWEATWTCTTPALTHIYTGNQTAPLCDAVIYDHAGPATNYSINRKDTTVVCSDNSQLLSVIFNHNETGLASGDTLWIFDGNSTLAQPLGVYITNSRIDRIVSSGTCLTFVFSSDNANQSKGWQGVISCLTVPAGQIEYTMSTGVRFVCSGKFLDPGGNGNYPRGSWVQTFTSYSGERLRFTRNSFNVNGNNGGHPFSVYDGPSTASPLIGTYTNFAFPPQVFQSTGSSLTFSFNSNNTSASVSAGWDYNISCFSGNPVDVMWISSPVCAGDTFLIDYILNDTVGAGNIITAQLSDMNGNFSSPLNIGTVSSIASGQIQVVIPQGTTAGSGYRIRMMSSVPVQIGNPSPNPLTVFAPPAVPVISPSGPVQICSGSQNVILSVTPQSGVNYQWYLNGSIAVGSNLPDYTAHTSGIYTVSLENSCATKISAPVHVDAVVMPLPPVIHAPADIGICNGQMVHLYTDSLSGVMFQWKNNGVNTGTDHFALNTGNPGVYSVEVSNACGTVNSLNSTEIIITGHVPSAPVILVTGNTNLCEGQSVELSVPALTGHDYEWKLDGMAVGSNSNELIVSNQGSYSVLISNHCGSAVSSNIILVTVTQVPPDVQITPAGQVSFCAGNEAQLSVPLLSEVNFLWYENGIPTGLNQPFIITDTTGEYTVSLSNFCGTTASSDTVLTQVNPLPLVTYIQVPQILCEGWSLVPLDGGLPAGGIYFGPGVSNNEINPALAGIGAHILTYSYTDSNGCSGADTSLVVIDACTHLSFSASQNIKILPNPATEMFSVICNEPSKMKELSVFTANGSLVFFIDKLSSNNTDIDISALSAGMYFLSIECIDNSKIFRKLLIQRE
jgi:hypothetical protein